MVQPEQAIYAILAGESDVTDIVGTRIRPSQMMQDDDPPQIAYTRISTEPFHHTAAASGMAVARIQIDCYAATYTAVKDLAEVIRLALSGFTPQEVTVGGNDLMVRALWQEGYSDGLIPPAEGEEIGTYRVTQDYMIGYTEPIPTF